MPKLSRKVPITERALIQRVTRALIKQDKVFKKARPGSAAEREYGPFYAYDARTQNVTNAWDSIQACALELGVLASFERFAGH